MIRRSVFPSFALAAAMTLLCPFAVAQPIQLKLAYFGSEDTTLYQAGIKPFMDAVNAEGKDLLVIKAYSNGALGKALAEQPKLVLDGTADIAWVIPGQTPYRFPDNQVLELPGQFRDLREGTLVYTRLIAANALRGYEDYFVIGAYTGNPTIIHSREPIGSLAALKGRKIRANNPMEAELLELLGAVPVVMPVVNIEDAIAKGTLDGAALVPTGLFDFGVGRVAKNHYLLAGGAAPFALVMSRKKFDSLPEAAQAIIRKSSGERAAAAWIEMFGAVERHSSDRLRAEYGHKIFEPSASDLQTARTIYRTLVNGWLERNNRNRELMKAFETELAAVRAIR